MQALAEATPSQFRDAPEPPPNPPPQPLPAVPGTTAPEIAAVYTAKQLQEAFHRGIMDIEIRSHLDLRTLPPKDNPITSRDAGERAIGWVGRDTRSIRVRTYRLPQTEPHVPEIRSSPSSPRKAQHRSADDPVMGRTLFGTRQYFVPKQQCRRQKPCQFQLM